MSMIYYYSAGSCSMVPHVVANELGLELDAIALSSDEKAIETYKAKINPTGMVPTLILQDKRLLTQNVAIIEYFVGLAEKEGKESIVYPKLGSFEHAQALSWLCFANADLHPSFRPVLYPHLAGSEAIRMQAIEKIMKLYEIVDQQYSKGSWIANNQYSAADVYIYTTVRWMKKGKLDWSGFKHLGAMIEEIEKRPAVKKTLAAHGQETLM